MLRSHIGSQSDVRGSASLYGRRKVPRLGVPWSTWTVSGSCISSYWGRTCTALRVSTMWIPRFRVNGKVRRVLVEMVRALRFGTVWCYELACREARRFAAVEIRGLRAAAGHRCAVQLLVQTRQCTRSCLAGGVLCSGSISTACTVKVETRIGDSAEV